MMDGQKLAAIPDHPKMTNQNTVRVGERIATVKDSPNAINERINVTFLESLVSVWLGTSGWIIF